MRIFCVCVLYLWSAGGFAQIPDLTLEQKAYLKEQGLPIPGSGVTVVDSKGGLHLTKRRLMAYDKAQKEQKKTGYIHERNDTAINLLVSRKKFRKELTRVRTLKGRRLQSDVSADFQDIKMAYPYKPITSSLYSKFIAFAPTGVYI